MTAESPAEVDRFDPVPITITDTAVAAFERDGFALVRAGFDAAAIAAIGAWTDELAAAPPRSGGPWVYHEDSRFAERTRLIARIENFSRFHAGFRALATVLGRAASAFLGEPAVLFKEKINF